MRENENTPKNQDAKLNDPELVTAFVEVVRELQPIIDDGSIWHLRGRWGRMAIEGINRGLLRLGPTAVPDAYGNIVPAFSQIKAGEPGSKEHYEEFWNCLTSDGPPI